MPLALQQIGQLLLEFLLDIVRFPVWWYTGGLKLVARWCWRSFELARWRVSLGKFLRSFFIPMYGDYTWQGRAISLFLRLFIVLWKTARVIVTAVWYLALLAAWVVLLPWCLYAIIPAGLW